MLITSGKEKWGTDGRNAEIISIRPYPCPNENVTLVELVYYSEGKRVKGLLGFPTVWERQIMQMYRNKNFSFNNKELSGLLYLRGGLQSIGMVRGPRIAQFAQQGFVVFAPYYRGNRGGEGKDEFVGVDRMDAINAIDVLRQFCGTAPVHVYGFSRGGLMALWAAIERDDLCSLVTWAGASDVTATYWERVDMRRGLKRIIGGTPNRVPELYDARTPLFEIDQINVPVLVVHGTEDQHVRIEHAKKLINALEEKNKRVEKWLSEGLRHHYPPNLNRTTVKDICAWMKEQQQ